MRGKDTQQSAMFSYGSAEQRVPPDHPLRPIREMVDVALKAMTRSFRRLYVDWGRPSITPEKLCERCYCRFCTRSGASGC